MEFSNSIMHTADVNCVFCWEWKQNQFRKYRHTTFCLVQTIARLEIFSFEMDLISQYRGSSSEDEIPDKERNVRQMR